MEKTEFEILIKTGNVDDIKTLLLGLQAKKESDFKLEESARILRKLNSKKYPLTWIEKNEDIAIEIYKEYEFKKDVSKYYIDLAKMKFKLRNEDIITYVNSLIYKQNYFKNINETEKDELSEYFSMLNELSSFKEMSEAIVKLKNIKFTYKDKLIIVNYNKVSSLSSHSTDFYYKFNNNEVLLDFSKIDIKIFNSNSKFKNIESKLYELNHILFKSIDKIEPINNIESKIDYQTKLMFELKNKELNQKSYCNKY